MAVANRIRGGTGESLALLDAAFRSEVPAQLGFNF
jgi:hypothetical protein